MKELSVADLAYMAGVLDGEGCISLYRHSLSGNSKARASTTKPVAAVLVIGNTSYELLEWVKARFGGRISSEKKGRGLNHKPIWEWRTSGPLVKEILEAVLPYLVIKRAQADLVIRYEDARSLERASTPCVLGAPRGGFSPSFQDYRNNCVTEIRALNKRGRQSSV